MKFVDENGNPLKNGTAIFKDVELSEKDTVADVYYPKNDYYNASSTTFSIKVKQDNNTEPDNNTKPDSNNTVENKTAKHIPSRIAEGNATGNPIAMMLLALFSLVITYRKR